MDDKVFKKCLVGLLIGTICVGGYWLFMTNSNRTVKHDKVYDKMIRVSYNREDTN